MTSGARDLPHNAPFQPISPHNRQAKTRKNLGKFIHISRPARNLTRGPTWLRAEPTARYPKGHSLPVVSLERANQNPNSGVSQKKADLGRRGHGAGFHQRRQLVNGAVQPQTKVVMQPQRSVRHHFGLVVHGIDSLQQIRRS